MDVIDEPRVRQRRAAPGGRATISCSVRRPIRAELERLAAERDIALSAYVAELLGERLGMEP